jgi:RNA polymerase sigma factor (TIGR02999 family)
MELLYDDLRSLADRYLRGRSAESTLQTTALVHEAYLRMARQAPGAWKDRSHFVAVAATAMRQILVNHVLARRAAKRGGGSVRVELDHALGLFTERAPDLVALDEALKRLSAMDETQGRVVELRFFGALSIEETAKVLGISHATVEREWSSARAWLRRELDREP